MSEMVERVARVLYDTRIRHMELVHSGNVDHYSTLSFDERADIYREYSRDAAHAAIKAMREPADEMVQAVQHQPGLAVDIDLWNREVWKRMIDKALEAEETTPQI